MIGGPKSTRSINEAGTRLETAGERMVGPNTKGENEAERARRIKYWDNMAEVAQQSRDKAKKTEEKVEKEKQIRECREAIGSINRTALYGIILKMKRKSTGWIAGSEEERKFIRSIDQALNDVVIEDKDPDVHFMEVRHIQKYKVKEKPKLVVNLNSYLEWKDHPDFIKGLIHEILHLSSISDKLNSFTGMFYAKFNKKDEFDREEYRALNEALTELITDEVEEEYLQATGDIVQARKSIRYKVYIFERMILKEIIKELAVYLEVGEREVMQAFMGHYFRADWGDVVGEIWKGIDNANIKKLFLMSRGKEAPTSYARSKRFEVFKRGLRANFSSCFRGLIKRFKTI